MSERTSMGCISSCSISGRKMSILEMLEEADLGIYYGPMKSNLKLRYAEHIKFVTDEDLTDLGMSRPEQRRLWKVFRRHFPNSIVGKLKLKMFGPGNSNNNNNNNNNNSDSNCSQNNNNNNNNNTKSHFNIKKKLNFSMDISGCSGSSQREEQHIIPESAISLDRKLGDGEFGVVWQGVWENAANNRLQVAVKCIEPEKLVANPLSFLHEAAIMHKINHPNIVRLFGVVLETRSVMLVTELAHSRSLLECLRDDSLRDSFPLDRLYDFCEQTVDGMCYLEANRFIHRDLAARNILVFASDKVKISDFGLSRSLGIGEDYYRSSEFADQKTKKPQPLAWRPPEAINFLKFTSASDVWAFGVTLWEIFSYGLQPWPDKTGAQILDLIDMPQSRRLDQPPLCPRDVYSLMLQCWEHDPNNRPRFSDIKTVMADIRPRTVKTVDECRDGQGDHLQYDRGQLITVLDERPREYPDGYYWRGVLSTSGRAGLFLPGQTVAYIRAEYPKPTLLSAQPNGLFGSVSNLKTSFGRGDKKKKPVLDVADRKKLIISEPQADFRHTGHVGLDGHGFGDVWTNNYSEKPTQFVVPIPQERLTSQKPKIAVNKPRAPSPDALDLDTPRFQSENNADTTSQSQVDSLWDEVFVALTEKDSNKFLANEKRNRALIGNRQKIGLRMTSSSSCDMTDEIITSSFFDDYTDTSQLISANNNNNNNNNNSRGSVERQTTVGDVIKVSAKPEALVRPMSVSEALKWEVRSEKAHKMADKMLEQTREKEEKHNSTTVRSDSVKSRVFDSIKALNRSISRESSSDRSLDTVGAKGYTEAVTASKDSQKEACWSVEAEQAYDQLVRCGLGLREGASQSDPNGKWEKIDNHEKLMEKDKNSEKLMDKDSAIESGLKMQNSAAIESSRQKEIQSRTTSAQLTSSKLINSENAHNSDQKRPTSVKEVNNCDQKMAEKSKSMDKSELSASPPPILAPDPPLAIREQKEDKNACFSATVAKLSQKSQKTNEIASKANECIGTSKAKIMERFDKDSGQGEDERELNPFKVLKSDRARSFRPKPKGPPVAPKPKLLSPDGHINRSLDLTKEETLEVSAATTTNQEMNRDGNEEIFTTVASESNSYMFSNIMETVKKTENLNIFSEISMTDVKPLDNSIGPINEEQMSVLDRHSNLKKDYGSDHSRNEIKHGFGQWGDNCNKECQMPASLVAVEYTDSEDPIVNL